MSHTRILFATLKSGIVLVLMRYNNTSELL